MKTAAHATLTQPRMVRVGDGPERAAGETGDAQKGARQQELSVKREVFQGSSRLLPTAA